MQQYEVIVPVRNGGEALAKSIQSVLSCSNSSRLLLTLSDNCSTDGSPWKKILEGFSREASRVISPPRPLGRVEHWTWAFDQARLPWVKPLMVGDRVDNAFWDWVGVAITANPDAGMFFCGGRILDPGKANPDPDDTVPSSGTPDTSPYSYQDFMNDAVACRNRIGALSGVLFRADTMRQSLPFEPEFPWTADWRFCKRFLQRMPAVETEAPLVTLDRSIPRVSNTWKGVRGSFREEWKFAAEQAASVKAPAARAFSQRFKVVGTKMVLVIGRRILPRPLRKFLTTAIGLHRPPLRSA